MHGVSSGSAFLVNAEVDSMGGVVDGGVGIGSKPSPRRAAIEKAQAELRLEYDVREERRRELEFLEKGGNPLDFKFVHAASLSVHSTSHTDQHPDQFLTSEAKGSFALTASPHGDSVESSGRLGVTMACEPNSADNFDGDNELLESARKSTHPGRGSVTRSQHSSQFDGNLNAKELDDAPIFHPIKGQAYRRRNRSRISRDGHRSSSIDMASRGGHCSTLSGRHGVLSKPIRSENQVDIESEGTRALHSSTTSRASEFPEGKPEVSITKDKVEELQNQGLKPEDTSLATSTSKPDMVTESENIINVDVENPCSPSGKSVNDTSTVQLKESSQVNGNAKCIQTEGLTNNTAEVTKGLGSDSSIVEASLRVGGNGKVGSDLCTILKNVDSNGAPKEQKLSLGEQSVYKEEKMVNDMHDPSVMESASCVKEAQNSICQQGNGFADKGGSSSVDEEKGTSNILEPDVNNHTDNKSDIPEGPGEDSVPKVDSSSPVVPSDALCRTDLSAPPPVSEPQSCADDQLKIVDKDHEDRVLEEARIIKAKRKRISELSACLLPREHRQKCQWDFVLEEMAWLANDFSQERLWKTTAAAQICHRAALGSRLKLEERNKLLKQRSVAHTLAKAVMEFWHSAGLPAENLSNAQSEKCLLDTSSNTDDIQVVTCASGVVDEDKPLRKEVQSYGEKQNLAIHGYAVRFLQFNCCSAPPVEVDDQGTSYLASDVDLPDYSWPDKFTEESLFYVVHPGAMEDYRRSIEACLAESERTGNGMQEEVDTSTYEAAAEHGYQGNNYEEDEGENAYYLPRAFDAGRASKKKRKNMKSFGARSYESGGDFGYGENRNGTPQSVIMGKRPINSLHVGPIPTKRMRTASRQRVVLPFNSGVAPPSVRADASSGDTNSFQDDHGGSIAPRGSEADSPMDLDKLAAFDSTETSVKPKKKKKIKHQVAAYDQRWQVDPTMQNEQKDLVRRRVESSHQLDSNGNSGVFGQHAKKPKMMKQSLDNSFENTVPMGGSVASPVASQMSNMSNQSKIIKLIGGRDRGRKAKALKLPAGPSGSGNAWSLFEDQALVVLVHDMGPNWELVSDAINSTLQFKCIFREPQECKERHKVLMDRTSGDGADSAEDSGSSQPYPSTLPGIPKGSARQLFQRLQGPMEEDTIKSHFEKIILIGQQLHYRKKQNDNQDVKHIAPVHSSHLVALSQVIPNNVNGGPLLTPLDLCDVASSSQEVLPLGYQGPHTGGLGLSNQGAIPPMHPSSGLNPSLQGSPGMGVGNNLASPQFNSPRDGRYAVPRSASLPIDEQQRMQQYNHMLPGRNITSSNLASPGGLSGGNDRGVRVLPGGNGIGMMAGMNRNNMAMPRPGLQGVNSGNMLAPNVGGNVHSPGQGNAMFRSRDALHMVRGGQSTEQQQRQMMLGEMQMQGAQPNSPGGAGGFGAVGSSGFPNQTSTCSSSVQTTHPGHQQQQHPHHVLSSPHNHNHNHSGTPTPEQQALLRIARERQLQQRLLRQQQQQQLPTSTSSALPQLPLQQANSQLQSQSLTSEPSPLTSPQLHQQQKHHAAVGRTAMANQLAKQRQRPPHQLHQSGRQHPQQQQQAKPLKGTGRGAHVSEKAEPSGNLIQLQGLYPGSATNSMQTPKPLASPQPQPQKPYANSIPTSKQAPQQMSSHLDSSTNANGGHIPGVSCASPGATVPNQAQLSSSVANHQHLPDPPNRPLKALNQQRPSQQSCVANLDSSTHQSQADEAPGALPPSADSTAISSSSPNTTTALGKVQESRCDSSILTTNSPALASNEPLPSVNQGLVQRQLSSSNMKPHGGGTQWQQHTPALQQSQQQPEQSTQQQPHPQIQVAQGHIFPPTTNSRLE